MANAFARRLIQGVTRGVVGLFLSCGLAGVLGCASGGGNGGAGALSLVQTVPADSATEVPTDIVMTAEFDVALDEATVTTSSFSLRRDGGADVEGSVTVAGPIVSYAPARSLGLLSKYTATLTTAIKGLSDQTLDMSQTWSFSTRDGQWGDPALIEISNAGNALDPQVAVDRHGNAVVVWSQWDGIRDSISANRFTPSGGWGAAVRIETDNAGNAREPQVALDPDGNALAVWSQSDGARFNIWANRFTPSGGWGVAERIETDDADDARMPQVAVDVNGNTVAVWYQSDGARLDIWANRFTPPGGWGVAERIETDAGGAIDPRVAVDPNGNAVAVWLQTDGLRSDVWANRFTPSAGWGMAERIETDDTGGANPPQVAADVNGNAVAVWSQSDGVGRDIWANRFTPPGGWGVAERIETEDAGSAGGPQVAVDANGNAAVVWHLWDGARYDLWANRFTPSGGWGVAERIEMNPETAVDARLAVDPSGNAVAIWPQSSEIWANRFTPSGGWGMAERIETDDSGEATHPQVAIDANGNAVAVWTHFIVGRFDVWANHFE